MATIWPNCDASLLSLSPLPPTPMQATLTRSLAPRTRPTYGKLNVAAPTAREVRRRNWRRVKFEVGAFGVICFFMVCSGVVQKNVRPAKLITRAVSLIKINDTVEREPARIQGFSQQASRVVAWNGAIPRAQRAGRQ